MVDTAADCTTKEVRALALEDLFPAGSQLAAVPVNFRGMSWALYEQLAAAAERTAAYNWFARFGAPIHNSGIAHPSRAQIGAEK